MLTRVMHIGILEPLMPSILENLKHKLPFVKKNAINLIYKIHLNFKNDLITDIDEKIINILEVDTNQSVLRAGLILLFTAN